MLFGFAIGNYEHWFNQILPKVIGFLDLKEKYPDLKILTWENKIIDYQLEIYKKLIDNFDDDFIKIPIDSSNIIYKFNKCIIPKIREFEILPELPFYEHLTIRDLLISKYITCDESSKYPQKIYISRRNLTNHWHNRRFVNEDDIWSVLRDRGYEEIFTDSMTFEDEIKHCYYAKNIVGLIGAGMMNIIFNNDGKYCIITHPLHRNMFSLTHFGVYACNRCYEFKDTSIANDNDINHIIDINIPAICDIDKLKSYLDKNNF
jgi:capsular polysaccharide biosynthesis protein